MERRERMKSVVSYLLQGKINNISISVDVLRRLFAPRMQIWHWASEVARTCQLLPNLTFKLQ